MSESRLIVALDFSDPRRAVSLVQRLDARRCKLKVGKELFCRAGPALVRRFVDDGFDVFLDLKFHDIPNTVDGACRAAVDMGVWMLNVHAVGGRTMLDTARRAVPVGPDTPRLIAVTVLTSLDAEQLQEVGFIVSPAEQVRHLASLAQQCGLDGVVSSAKETAELRRIHGPTFLLVTPGIRPAGAALEDQSRVMTPREALDAGSDYLVIGRPVTAAEDPMRAVADIESELALGPTDC